MAKQEHDMTIRFHFLAQLRSRESVCEKCLWMPRQKKEERSERFHRIGLNTKNRVIRISARILCQEEFVISLVSRQSNSWNTTSKKEAIKDFPTF